jgi:hypothetical protein
MVVQLIGLIGGMINWVYGGMINWMRGMIT